MKLITDEFACLEYCKSEQECLWLTYFPGTRYCQLFKDCPILDTEFCPDCLTSQQDCIPDDPICRVVGECEGVLNHTEVASSPEGCLKLCNSTTSCRWSTFNSDVSECLIFQTCPTIDESCLSCTSGIGCTNKLD